MVMMEMHRWITVHFLESKEAKKIFKGERYSIMTGDRPDVYVEIFFL